MDEAPKKKKKQLSEIREFVNFFKDFYVNFISLNFDKFFVLSFNGSNVEINFPSNEYYYLCGTLDITGMPSFNDFLRLKSGSIKINNDDLNILRKCKVKELIDEPCKIDDDMYVLKYLTNDGIKNEIKLLREPYNNKPVPFESKYSLDIDSSLLNNQLLFIYMKDNKLTLDRTSDIVFVNAIKNFKNIFKKEAEYKIYATEKDKHFRKIMFESKSGPCILKQYFRVI